MLVVEDEALVSLLLTDLLTRAGFEVTTCASAAEVNTLVKEFDPDVALLDINLGGGPSGLDVGHILHRAYPHVGLVFLTKFLDPRVRRERAIPPGSAFLDKRAISDVDALINAIEQVLHNETAPTRHDVQSGGGLDVLTPTQLETLRLAALGWTNAAIARRRNTHERAVEKRLRAVYRALDVPVDGEVNPRVEAVRRYIAQAGLPAHTAADLAAGGTAADATASGKTAGGATAAAGTPAGKTAGATAAGKTAGATAAGGTAAAGTAADATAEGAAGDG